MRGIEEIVNNFRKHAQKMYYLQCDAVLAIQITFRSAILAAFLRTFLVVV